MQPPIGVLSLTDAFADVIARLVEGAGGRPVPLRAGDDPARHPGLAAVIVAAGGAEETAAAAIPSLRAAVPAPVAVVALDAPHRAVAAIVRAGADEFVQLPADLPALNTWVREQVERARAAEGEDGGPAGPSDADFAEIVGDSPALRRALEQLALVAPASGATVLITGETGTGKDLLAGWLHRHSPRAREPFVEVNCAALPPHLIESELFGHEAGAFTDARRPKAGLVEVADRGTLFLDEIGDLPLDLQAKLLRVIETRQTRRVGALQPTRLDVRFVAATHVDLEERVRAGHFREDLFYRLNVVRVELPPLRARGEDVLLLADWFARAFAAEYALPLRPLSPTVRQRLLEHPWPGNVRELRNAMERAVILGRGVVREENLRLGAPPAPAAGGLPFPATMAEVQVSAARAALEVCGGNKTRAAQMLGISRRHLYVLLGLAPGDAAP